MPTEDANSVLRLRSFCDNRDFQFSQSLISQEVVLKVLGELGALYLRLSNLIAYL